MADENNDDVLLLSAEHLGSDLMGLCLQELKALPDVWQKLSEDWQRGVIDRVQSRVDDAVRQAVNLIASSGKTSVVADLAGVAIKGGVSATLKVASTNTRDALHALYEATGQACLLVIASPEEFVGGMAGSHQPDPQQPALDLDNAADDNEDGPDGLYELAVERVRKTNRASISAVQRGLCIGYNRAARLIELMEARGVVTPMDATGKRDVVLMGSVDEVES